MPPKSRCIAAATATATREMRMVVLVQEPTWSLGKNDTNFPIQKSSFVKSRNKFGLKTSWSKTKILNPNGPKGPSPKWAIALWEKSALSKRTKNIDPKPKGSLNGTQMALICKMASQSPKGVQKGCKRPKP